MIGFQIYLLFCEYKNGDKQLQTPHATFDGAHEHMEQIKSYWRDEKGCQVNEGLNGTLEVLTPFGEFFRKYYVVTRTIEK